MKITEALNSLFQYLSEKNIIFRAALTALVVSFVAAAIVIVLMNLSFDTEWKPQFLNPSSATRLSATAIFIVLFIAIFVLTIVLLQRGADDLLTPYRKQLTGLWSVHAIFMVWQPSSQKLVPISRETSCIIRINHKRKLVFSFSIRKSELFEDHDAEVELISLNIEPDPKQCIYYICNKLRIKEKVAEYIGANPEIIQKTFVHLEYHTEKDKVNKMYGTWYDLGGDITDAIDKINKLSASNTGNGPIESAPKSGSVEFIRREFPSA